MLPKGGPFVSPLRVPWRASLHLWGRRILTGGLLRGSPPASSRCCGGRGAEGSGKGGSGMAPRASSWLWGAGSSCGRGHAMTCVPAHRGGFQQTGKAKLPLPEWHSAVELDRNSSRALLGSFSASSSGDSRLPLTQLQALEILFCLHSSLTSTGTQGIALQV